MRYFSSLCERSEWRCLLASAIEQVHAQLQQQHQYKTLSGVTRRENNIRPFDPEIIYATAQYPHIPTVKFLQRGYWYQRRFEVSYDMKWIYIVTIYFVTKGTRPLTRTMTARIMHVQLKLTRHFIIRNMNELTQWIRARTLKGLATYCV